MSNTDNIWVQLLIEVVWVAMIMFIWNKIAKRLAIALSKKLSRVLRRDTATA